MARNSLSTLDVLGYAFAITDPKPEIFFFWQNWEKANKICRAHKVMKSLMFTILLKLQLKSGKALTRNIFLNMLGLKILLLENF